MGKYYLYSVADENGIEMAYFATEIIHNLIQSHQMKPGSLMQLTKRNRGIEFAIVGESLPEAPAEPSADHLKEIMLQCVIDARDIIRDSGIQMGNDELQKLATTLFIQRAKNA